MGLVAIRDIKKGEIIFEERPILVWKYCEDAVDHCNELLNIYKCQFLTLPQPEQDSIMNLHNAHPDSSLNAFTIISRKIERTDEQLQKWLGIIFTNAFKSSSVVHKSSPEVHHLYVNSSRFNHSCMPNSEQSLLKE